MPLPEEPDSEASDCEDPGDADQVEGLSYVGNAAQEALSTKHKYYRKVCWNVTHGKVVGEILQTPPSCYFGDNQIGDDDRHVHSDFFPDNFSEIISQAEKWVDFTSLGPPDGKFLDAIAKGLNALHEAGKSVVVRLLVGNIVGMPTDVYALRRALTKHPDYPIPNDTSLQIWIGAWRKGLSWNHAKIVAVDGKILLTGGHNVWDAHYLKRNPVRDVSMKAEGQVANDGHVFANRMWKFIIRKDKEYFFSLRAPGWMPLAYKSRVGICHWPKSGPEDYPPLFEPESEPLSIPDAIEQGDIPMVTCGRYGSLHHEAEEGKMPNPSDSAIVAMLSSAQTSIKMTLQDLGPIAVPLPGGAKALPGCVWPADYLREIGLAIYERGVDVMIVLSNPNSIPADLSPTEANYGNGWTCDDVAAQIIDAIVKEVPDVDEERIAGLVGVNLKIAFIRTSSGCCDWEERGAKSGNHSKFFMIDDICYYIGSQNLYIANLAEWGVIVDNEEQTAKVLDEFWNPIWKCSFEDVAEEDRDLNLDRVLESRGVDKGEVNMDDLNEEEIEAMYNVGQASGIGKRGKKLVVVLKSASNLSSSDEDGKGADPYVKFQILNSEGTAMHPPALSKVCEDSLDPVWNEQFDFEGLTSPAEYVLVVNIMDKDSDDLENDGGDDRLGKKIIELGALKNTDEFEDMELMLADGWFSDTTLTISLSTAGEWGADPE